MSTQKTGDAVAVLAGEQGPLGGLGRHPLLQQGDQSAGLRFEPADFDHVVTQQVVDVTAKVHLQQFHPAQHVHLGQLVRVERVEFLAGLVKRVELLLPDDGRGHVVGHRDQFDDLALLANRRDRDIQKPIVVTEAKAEGLAGQGVVKGQVARAGLFGSLERVEERQPRRFDRTTLPERTVGPPDNQVGGKHGESLVQRTDDLLGSPEMYALVGRWQAVHWQGIAHSGARFPSRGGKFTVGNYNRPFELEQAEPRPLPAIPPL